MLECVNAALFPVFQTFTASVSQVFPAEDDINKHVEDNCKCVNAITVKIHFGVVFLFDFVVKTDVSTEIATPSQSTRFIFRNLRTIRADILICAFNTGLLHSKSVESLIGGGTEKTEIVIAAIRHMQHIRDIICCPVDTKTVEQVCLPLTCVHSCLVPNVPEIHLDPDYNKAVTEDV